jgi:hypothetical protein
VPVYACDVGFSPFPSFGDTDGAPVLETWKDAGVLVQRFRMREGVCVSIDVSDVLDALAVCNAINQGSDTEADLRELRRWAERDYVAKLGVQIESLNELTEPEANQIVHSTIQHLFLAQCLSVQGGGHLNAAHRIGSPKSQLEEDGNYAYYGDSLEAAWSEASSWAYPPLVRLQFSDVWGWLIRSGFDRCSVALSPLHKALVTLLTIARHPTRTAASDVLALSQALEAMLSNSTERVGSSLKSRVDLILGEPLSHKRWLTDFYALRSRIIHGAFPIIRPGIFGDESDVYRHEDQLLRPVDRATAVLMCLLQRLITSGSSGFSFVESFSHNEMG